MREDIASILLSEEQIHTRVRELGAEISRDYAGKEPLFVGVLKGCFIFMADLFREVTIHGSVDFNRDVIIVEDILDSGITLSYLTKYLQNRKPSSICIATLLDKPARRRADVQAKYVGFTVPDAFVVGYGLDYAEKYRNLPFIGVLKPEVYEK